MRRCLDPELSKQNLLVVWNQGVAVLPEIIKAPISHNATDFAAINATGKQHRASGTLRRSLNMRICPAQLIHCVSLSSSHHPAAFLLPSRQITTSHDPI
jgi:hypothetical protein